MYLVGLRVVPNSGYLRSIMNNLFLKKKHAGYSRFNLPPVRLDWMSREILLFPAY